MKLMVFLITCIVSIFSSKNICYANSNYYCQIVSSGALLYRSDNLDNAYQNVYMEVENTYFARLLYESEYTYKVEYNGVIGYLSKSAVKRISGTPQNPYPNNIKLTVNQNCYLRSTPTQSDYGNEVMLLSTNTQLDFVGLIHASRLTDFGDNTWYYVKCNNTYGYIFADYLKSRANIYPNTEKLSYVDNFEQMSNPLSDASVSVIVCLLTLPAVGIIIIMYHKPKVNHKSKVNHT